MTNQEQSTNPYVVNTSADCFEADVIERSNSVPIVVDFWAPWCGPCRALSPVLEEIASEFAGRFILVKANTEEVPNAAAEFRVQSIPAVYGLRDGRIVDGFMGAMPKAEIEAWLERLLPSETDELVAGGRKLVVADPVEAEKKLRKAIALSPNQFEASIALADLLLQVGRDSECAELLNQLQERGFLEPEAERIRAALELKQQGDRVGSVDTCRTRLADAPDDPQLRLELAEALAASTLR